MLSSLKTFQRKHDGAVTVEWVVISAAVIGLSAILVSRVATGTDSMAARVTETIVAVPKAFKN